MYLTVLIGVIDREGDEREQRRRGVRPFEQNSGEVLFGGDRCGYSDPWNRYSVPSTHPEAVYSVHTACHLFFNLHLIEPPLPRISMAGVVVAVVVVAVVVVVATFAVTVTSCVTVTVHFHFRILVQMFNFA